MIARLLLLWFCLGLVVPVRAAVLVSEIHYHPVEEAAFDTNGVPLLDLTADLHEFVELHNPAAEPVLLSGWSLAGSADFPIPEGTVIAANGYLVIAGHPDRITTVYGLPASSVLGPWTGQLGNRKGTVRLRDAAGKTVEDVGYQAASPWPVSADALGADEEWTGLRNADYQYRGRSLERVSFTQPASDPANWLASPLTGPSPGRANTVQRDVPKPVVLLRDVRQAADGATLLRPGNPVRIEVLFSAVNNLRDVHVEWFLDDINRTNETRTLTPMLAGGLPAEGRFLADLPGQAARSILRWRVRADRGEGDEIVSPRTDDPYAWHANFAVPPRPVSTNDVYDVFISTASLTTLSTNISQATRRYTLPDPPGLPRKSWNATQPIIFVRHGIVIDARLRYHGSQFRRDPSRKSYKAKFPAYAPFDGRESMFITDKDYRTAAGHAVFRAANLPTSRTWPVDLYLNSNARLLRLAQEEYGGDLLDRYEAEQAILTGTAAKPAGEFYKSEGVFDEPSGPYGRGDGSLLKLRTNRGTNVWTPLQRYEWTYALQSHGWKGHTAFKTMIDGMWAARNNSVAVPTGAQLAKLKTYFDTNFDVDRALTHMALINWQGAWDDTIHNNFLWQQSDGRWSILPWDFDDQFNASATSVSIYNGAPFAGPNYVKQGLVTAYRERFQKIAWQLNNTLLDPDNLAALGLNSLITKTWAVTRQKNVNTQLALGLFTRPLRPTNREPANLALIGSQARLRTSDYAYNTNAVNAHAATVWQFRRTNETWFTPLLTLTNTSSLTELPLPIGSLSLGETYAWRVQYLDAIGHPSSWSAATAFRFGGPTNPAVRLNEILADNVSSVRNGSDTPDFVELFNSTADAVDLGGWSLTDDLNFPTRFGLPAGTMLPAGGYLVVWCDDNTTAPGIHAGFSLKRPGGTIALFSPDTAGAVLADVLQFGRQVSDLSLGRDPANGLWTLGQPTPAAANQAIALGDVTQLRLNEWAANPKSGSDWFEVFNPESAPVSLAGCLFTDDLSAPGKSPVPAFSFIGAGEFVKFTADDNTAAGGDHVAFKLASDGTALALLLTTNRVVDRVFIGAQTSGVSGGRVPDGGPIVYSFTTPTPGKRNTADADNDGLPDSWEQTYGLMVGVQDDEADPDGDGLSNRLEYRLGTNPTSAASAFHLELQIPNGADGGKLVFLATPNLTYFVERYDLTTDLWAPFTTINGLPAHRVIEVPLDLTASNDGALFRVNAQ